uniref:Uncharacterized protein n=1 Tax=Oryza punctata TaxID=4537 RepID=A0A0E0LBP6_ORYPU
MGGNNLGRWWGDLMAAVRGKVEEANVGTEVEGWSWRPEFTGNRRGEIVPLRKVCRRPETDYRLQILHAARAAGMAKEAVVDLVSHNDKSSAEQKLPKQHKMMDVNTDEVTVVSNPDQEEPTGKPAATLPAAPIKTLNDSASASDVQMGEAQAAPKVESSDEVEDKMKEG